MANKVGGFSKIAIESCGLRAWRSTYFPVEDAVFMEKTYFRFRSAKKKSEPTGKKILKC
jgi:hypothetical protein